EYNGLNQRIKKTVGTTVTKSFFNENWQEIESVTDNQVTSYVWGLRYIDDLVLREKGEERLYSLADPNWNVVAICNNNGVIQERYTYNAFGKQNVFDADFTAKTETEFDWNRAFTGQVLDIETNLMLYRNRHYHTGIGRFVRRDPIGYYSRDVNIYRYIRNAISSAIDPDGLYVRCACACSWGRIKVLMMADSMCSETPINDCCASHCTNIGCSSNGGRSYPGPVYPPTHPPTPPTPPTPTEDEGRTDGCVPDCRGHNNVSPGSRGILISTNLLGYACQICNQDSPTHCQDCCRNNLECLEQCSMGLPPDVERQVRNILNQR
ncbi:MAG: RHS repeat-associated core domain-containing protein, partial [Planctomycetaceae bacterium]|nr:RHS repeat-associated core domain-containing protein [Planctomycetaceae bacterium]